MLLSISTCSGPKFQSPVGVYAIYNLDHGLRVIVAAVFQSPVGVYAIYNQEIVVAASLQKKFQSPVGVGCTYNHENEDEDSG